MGPIGHARHPRARFVARAAVWVGVGALVLSSLVPIALARAGSAAPSFGSHSIEGKRDVARSRLASARSAAREARAHPRPKADSGRVLRGTGTKPARRPSGVAVAGSTPSAGASGGPAALIAAPAVSVVAQWSGMGQAEAGNWAPPDPWVAASPSFVVQTVNAQVKVWDRNGVELLSVPDWALFGLPADQIPSDPRIVWDAVHGRWVGVLISVKNDSSYATNYLTVIVSDTADPTLGWTMIPVSYSGEFPDFPSLASSGDKIVVADNLYDSSNVFLGADLNTFTWASILGGGALTYNYCEDASFGNPRAAQVLSASNDVHVILESVSDSHQSYVRLGGSGTCASTTNLTDLTSSNGLDAFALPPDPRQVGADTISNAVDERPTDAVWQAGRLWWVSTFPVTYDAGSTWNDEVVLWGTTTTATGAPAGSSIIGIQPGDGIDAFMGGVGLSRNGSVFVTYSQSSATDPVALYANQVAGGLLGTPVLLASSGAASSSERWGDFAGVAMDPVGTGAVWASHMVAGADGAWKTVVARLLVDADAPSTPGAPTANALTSTTLTASPSYRIAWSGSTDASSGTVRYRVEQSVDGGAFGAPTWLAGLSLVRALPLGHTYRFRATAVDPLSHASGTATGPTLRPILYQLPTSRTGTWGTQPNPSYSGGTTLYASANGASATFTTTGVRSLGFVTTRATSRGSFRVYIDGVLKGTVSATSSANAYRRIAYQFTWSTAGTHTIKIVVLGTSGHPRIDVDAFLVLK